MSKSASTTTASKATQLSGSSVSQPGITYLLPFLSIAGHGLFTFFNTLTRYFFTLSKKAARPLLYISPIPILLYLLAPAIVFIQVVLDLTILAPLRLVRWFADVIYPIYVFVGVACITGALLGLAGRWVANALIGVLQAQAEAGSVKGKEIVRQDNDSTLILKAEE